jgi:Flp pilus assembly pilin Flp
MTKIIEMTMKVKIWKDTNGQDLTEYALMAGFLACAAGFTLPFVATQIATVLGNVAAILMSTPGGDTAPGA